MSKCPEVKNGYHNWDFLNEENKTMKKNCVDARHVGSWRKFVCLYER